MRGCMQCSVGNLVRTLRGHSGGVVAVVFSPDGKRVVSCADEEEEVKMWNAETGAEVWASRCHDTTNGCICAREGAEHGDENVVWKPECPVFGHASWVQAVAFSSDGKRVVSGSLDTLVLIWNAETGAGSASLDMLVIIWNAETGAGVRTLAGHSDCVHTVAFSLDGKRVVSGAADSLVILWDTATGAEVRSDPGSCVRIWVVA
ncbi:quinon protein alcohol dehydrogenase-like superfamily [Baffinella frigidus]|nr:quinon protein alcohol dehydrogenase-like superfamily [Cryptophyta sp. CCMP2293]